MMMRGINPGIFWNQACADSLEFKVVEYSVRTALDMDMEAGVKRSSGGGKGDCGPVKNGL